MTNRVADLVVVGAGPAGRALAHRSAVAGLQVALVDPHAEKPWTATYAAWADDVPEWVDPATISATCESIAVYAPARRLLPRSYVTLGTTALQRSLPLPGVRIHPRAASAVSAASVWLDDGTEIRGRAVVDARGLRDPAAPAQTAFGVIVERAAAAPVLAGDDGIMMDWRGAGAHRVPSFLYAIPLDDDRVLLEETCLAAAPPMHIGELRERLRNRLSSFGLDLETMDVIDTETVHFALHDTIRRPWTATPPVRFGAAGGMMHPATGYSVAESLRSVDRMVTAVSVHRDLTRALWPRQARAVHLLRLRGLGVLLSLPPDDLVEFFDTFFRAPEFAQRAYLSNRQQVAGTAALMAAVVTLGDKRLSRKVIRSAVSR